MSGQKCNYFNCGKSKRNNPDLSFHTFPSNEHTMKTWIIHSGNIALDNLSPKKLRKRYICSDHFDKNMFMNLNQKVRKLIPNATPMKYAMNNSGSSPKYENSETTNFETPVKKMKPVEIQGRILDFDTKSVVHF
ncbi:THAP-type domain-containing protein [Aphis craccivora]|uniref:THAP-type domain-containing protein n=1 Tax=Aphis craccivora TaxID=307492 RepID=A0A6G0YG70_APHCR|nr:THAP-type domain-containing protein [Aphis craccivora]